jgi:acetolactate synthase-1/3 small subunit
MSAGPDPTLTTSTDSAVRHHILSVLVENKAGVLTRVAGLFARRGFNIHSLAVAPTDNPALSRITMAVDVQSAPLEQMVKQLDKLINVIEITELAPGESIERELLLVTVQAPAEVRSQVIELVGVFEGRVLNVGRDQLIVSLEGSPTKLDDFEELARDYGIAAIQRSGRVALPTLRSEAGSAQRARLAAV